MVTIAASATGAVRRDARAGRCNDLVDAKARAGSHQTNQNRRGCARRIRPGNRLMKIPITAGVGLALCDAVKLFGASWSADGTIPFGKPAGDHARCRQRWHASDRHPSGGR
jgi:hypothetical protein